MNAPCRMGGLRLWALVTAGLSPLTGLLLALVVLIWGSTGLEAGAARHTLDIAKVYFEYNASANDLGVHVFVDGEDWQTLTITNPAGRPIFTVKGTGPYRALGLTELFFEGAEPSLDDVPLEALLDLFPEGTYTLAGQTVDHETMTSTVMLTHAIPDGPEVSAELGPNHALTISWEAVTGPPAGFPEAPITIIGYQVIVGTFQVTVPATVRRVTVPPEFVATIDAGDHEFEVLAVEAGGNQTITEGVFVMPAARSTETRRQ